MKRFNASLKFCDSDAVAGARYDALEGLKECFVGLVEAERA
jgi:hypothetical protein